MIKTISSREKELYKDFVESKIFSNREEVYFRFTVDKIKALQNKKKIYSNFLCQLFHVKEEKLLAIRVLAAIEQVFGLYFSVFFEYSYGEEELIEFLFRSEETVEWVTGARELGKRALHDSGYKEILSTYLKDKSDKNVRTLRHALTALLSYLTESVKTGKKEEEFSIIYEESDILYKEKMILPSDYFLYIFKNFEILGINEVIQQRIELKELLDKNLNRIIKIAGDNDHLNSYYEKIRDSINTKKEELAGQTQENKSLEKAVKLLQEQSDLLAGFSKKTEGEPCTTEEIALLGDIFKEKVKEIDNFFKKFDRWAIGSIYFAFPEFLNILEDEENRAVTEFSDLNTELLLSGMIFYGIDRSPEYFKNGLYMLDILKDDYKTLYSCFEKIYPCYLKIIKDKYEEYFVEILSEISLITGKKSIDILLDNSLILPVTSKDPKNILLQSYDKLYSSVESADVFGSRTGGLEDYKILFSLSIKEGIDYNTAEKCIFSLLREAIKREKEFVPFLVRELKILFYNNLTRLFYLNQKEINPKDVDKELTKQLLAGYIIAKEWTVPERTVKELGIIFARIIQTAFLLDSSSAEINFKDEISYFFNKFYTLFYIIPEKKLFTEMKYYMPGKEIAELFTEIGNLINTDMNEQEEFNNYFSMLETYNINFKTVFNHMICRSELDEKSRKFLCQLISNKEYFNKIESETIEIIRNERGEEFLKNYVVSRVNNEIKALEHIMKNRSDFLESIMENKSFNIEDFKKMLEEDIKNINALKDWTGKNFPYIEEKYAGLVLSQKEMSESYLYDAIKQGDEGKVLEYYSNIEYKKYHPFIEKWLAKRLLFDEILNKCDRKNTFTLLGKSYFRNIFTHFYQFTTNVFTVFTFILLPYIFYLTGVERIGNIVFSVYITAINFLLPVTVIYMAEDYLYKAFFKKEKGLPSAGILYRDFFLPKLFGLILVSAILCVNEDILWAVNFNQKSAGLWSPALLLMVTIIFIQKSLGETDAEKGLPSMLTRAWRVVSTGLLESYIILLFYIEALSGIMVKMGCEKGLINLSQTSYLFGIPKVTVIDVLMPSLEHFPCYAEKISFAPFFLLNMVIIVVFIGAVLTLFLSKDRIE